MRNDIAEVERGCGPGNECQRSTLGLRCQLATDFSQVSGLQAIWDEAVLRLGSPIYMTFDWVKTWWEFYARGKPLRLFLFWLGEELVAILPFYLESFGFGPARTTVGRLVGANIPPKTFNPPVDIAFAREVFSLTTKHLFRNDRCDWVALGPVSAAWPCNSMFSERLDTLGPIKDLVRRICYSPRDVQVLFVLPPTFEDYLKTLSSTERKNRMKRVRHLERNYKVSTDIVADQALVEREFESFLVQHARQWRAFGKGGHFAAWPMAHEFNRALVKAQAKHGRVRFFRMLIDGSVVANRYTFLLGKTLYSELPAREVGEPWDKLGIGAVSLLKFNEAAIKEGVKLIDSGLGEYEHKSSLGGVEIPVGTWHLFARGFGGLKARMFSPIAKWVIFVCRKIWYRRVLPRMPERIKRTQHMWWLRFDL